MPLLTLHFLNTDISGNGGYADDDDNDGVATMSEEEDEIGDLVDEGEDDFGDLVDKESGSTSGGAANDAMQEDALLLSSPGAHLLVCHLGMQHNSERLI